MRRHSSSGKARHVSMRTLPLAPMASDSLTAVSSSGASATTTASHQVELPELRARGPVGDTRHSAVTNLVGAGVPEVVAMALR